MGNQYEGRRKGILGKLKALVLEEGKHWNTWAVAPAVCLFYLEALGKTHDPPGSQILHLWTGDSCASGKTVWSDVESDCIALLG